MTATIVSWIEQSVDIEGRSWAYRSAGAGEPVLVLDAPGDPGQTESLELFGDFVDRWRLVATRLPAACTPTEHAASLAELLRALDVSRCSVVARGSAAAAALWLAAEHDEVVDKLVLESPELDVALFDRLPGIDAPTLVLLGQRAEAAAPANTGIYKRLPGSTIGLVYDAGADIRGDRPSAYTAAVSDYLERGQAFVVNTRSSVINH